MQSVTITMPIPPRTLSPNASHSRNYFAKSTARRQQRTDAMLYAASACPGACPRWERFRVSIRWFAKDKSKVPDLDNGVACCKGIIDGMVDAGIMANDKGWEGVDWWPLTDKARPRVEVTVTPVPTP